LVNRLKKKKLNFYKQNDNKNKLQKQKTGTKVGFIGWIVTKTTSIKEVFSSLKQINKIKEDSVLLKIILLI
jgi:hypothetical protein